MNKKKGFALIESIFMIVFLSVALILVYKAFSVSFQDERKRVYYDNTEDIYEAYFVKQYFEENGLLTYLSGADFTNGYVEITCSTITSVNSEYCSFLTGSNNFDINKMYVTMYDMTGVNYTNLDPTTVDYFNTLSSGDVTSYRLVIWFKDNHYASLKIGEPLYSLRILLDGGSWNGINFQKMNSGDTAYIGTPVKAGYTFNGWYLSGGGSSIVGNTFTMGSGDTVLVALWLGATATYSYTGNYQTFTVPATGYYKIEAWGAAGGESLYTTNYSGGKGGYTSGVIYLTKSEEIYIYVGGKGQTVSGTTTGTLTANGNGYNGGGYGGFAANNSDKGGGGGATDIRYFGSTIPTSSDLLWNSALGLNSRIMTAGGGGGSSSHASTPSYSGTGGAGGSLIGNYGIYASTTCYAYGIGGTQMAGGSSTNCPVDGHAYTSTGSFGIGHTFSSSYCTDCVVAGGGSGYYGGGGGFHAPAGGGSSFISGYAGVNAITSSSSTAATNNTKHYSNKYFINSEMTSGVRSGNGGATITYLGEEEPERTNTNLNNVRYIKDCRNGDSANTGNYWVELQAIYQGVNIAKGLSVTGTSTVTNASYITDGDITSANYAYAYSDSLQCITVDLGQAYNLDEVAVWHYWADGRTTYNNTTYVSSDNSTWTPVIANTDAETSQGKRVNAYEELVDLVPIFRNPNILTNSDFSSYTTTTYAWDNSLNRNPAIVPTNWFGGYNSGVTSPSLGYHARFDNAPFGYNVMVFPNLNSVIGISNRWMGISQTFSTGVILPSTTYVVTMDIYDNAVNHLIAGGIYYYNSSTSTWEFGSVWYIFTTVSNDLNKWVTKQATFTTPSALSTADQTSFYVYGMYGSEGTAYVKNVYLVKK